MDPSIMKLLEEDEDETMHSGADVEAFTAALNRDIEGDTSASQPSDSESAALSQGSSYTSSQFLTQWQSSTHDENTNAKSQQNTLVIQQNVPQAAEMDLKHHGPLPENQKPQDGTSQELNRFSMQQHKPFRDDSFEPQAELNMLNVSQTMHAQDPENIPLRNQGPERTQNPDNESQLAKLQNANSQHASITGMSNQQALAAATGNQQAMATGSSNQQTVGNRGGRIVPFAMLLPVIQPQLDKDRAMQLNTLYLKLRKNEITKEGFVRHMRSIVGDQMLKMAVFKLQSQAARNSQNPPNQLPTQSQAPAPAPPQQFPSPSTAQIMTDSSSHGADDNTLKSREVERQSDPHAMQSINKQPPPQVHFSQASFPGGNYHPFSAMSTNASASTHKSQSLDSQTRQLPGHQSMGTSTLGSTTPGAIMSSMTKFDRQNSLGDLKRSNAATLPHMITNSTVQQSSLQWQPSPSKEQKSGAPSSIIHVKQEPLDQSNAAQGLSTSVHADQGAVVPRNLKDEPFEMQASRMGFPTTASTLTSNPTTSSISTQMESITSLNPRVPSATSPIALGNNAKALQKKPTVGQKKPLETLGSPPPPSSKKQKVSGALADQSIEQLNDVTAVSGVNLREEEEQLFSGPKEDSRVSEASRRVVQEEEERLILEKIPLQRKLAEIMAKNGLKGMSNDVERCLSLCVEERIRGLLGNLIRLSKQRLDIEKPRHKSIITSDVRHQIMVLNRKAKEECDRKQAETEKLQRQNEPEGSPAVDGDKEKDDGRGKSVKVNKEEDDKMRATAANVAARAAVGGDDMFSKWQLMAEQARQKREGVSDITSGSQTVKDAGRKLSSRSTRETHEAEKRGQTAATSSPGAVRKVGRNQVIVPQAKVARSISVKDVIAILEREPQMSKSTLMYCLYEKVRADATAE